MSDRLGQRMVERREPWKWKRRGAAEKAIAECRVAIPTVDGRYQAGVEGGSGSVAAREQAIVVVGGPQEWSSSRNVKPGGVRRRVGIRVVESEGANTVELVNGEMFTSGPRVDPLPSTGARQVELHDGARVRPRPVLVCRVQPVLRRAVRMPERAEYRCDGAAPRAAHGRRKRRGKQSVGEVGWW